MFVPKCRTNFFLCVCHVWCGNVFWIFFVLCWFWFSREHSPIDVTEIYRFAEVIILADSKTNRKHFNQKKACWGIQIPAIAWHSHYVRKVVFSYLSDGIFVIPTSRPKENSLNEKKNENQTFVCIPWLLTHSHIPKKVWKLREMRKSWVESELARSEEKINWILWILIRCRDTKSCEIPAEKRNLNI